MENDLSIRCRCGGLEGVVARGTVVRVICHCDDCQSFAHFLGKPDQVLDSHGGTDILQISPARVQFTKGQDKLACVRLSDKGILRWYATCCQTPVGNTLPNRNVAFVGLVLPLGMRSTASAVAGKTAPKEWLDKEVGPVDARIFARFAKSRPEGRGVYDRGPISMIVRVASDLLLRRLGGDHLRSPFFDAESGHPVAEPQVLTADERREVETRRDAWGS